MWLPQSKGSDYLKPKRTTYVDERILDHSGGNDIPRPELSFPHERSSGIADGVTREDNSVRCDALERWLIKNVLISK